MYVIDMINNGLDILARTKQKGIPTVPFIIVDNSYDYKAKNKYKTIIPIPKKSSILCKCKNVDNCRCIKLCKCKVKCKCKRYSLNLKSSSSIKYGRIIMKKYNDKNIGCILIYDTIQTLGDNKYDTIKIELPGNLKKYYIQRYKWNKKGNIKYVGVLLVIDN